ncbi:MAG: MBL fold metallo-hydrolase [Candidatus Micrarchaeia archaeon]
MASLTLYGGVNEIGGNKILVEDRGSRVFLDFGQSFSLLDDYFVPEVYLTPRERFGLRDYFEFNLVPKLKGLYSKEAIERTDLSYSEPEFDAVFISHAHFDHVAHLQYLHEAIPVYMGEATKMILESTEITTKNRMLPEGEVRTFRSGREISVDNLTITPIHVDHSVPGAYGFIVETSEGAVVYTGDFRLHGPKGVMSTEFIEKVKEVKPEALVIEGTRVLQEEKRKNFSEEMVYSESRRIVSETDKFVMTMRYPKDLDRFMTFYRVANECGRELVVSMKTAHLLIAVQKDERLKLPDPRRDSVLRIYGRELKRYDRWMKELMKNAVDYSYVAENQKKVILELDLWCLPELIDIQPKGGECIHSMSEPFEEDPISQVSDEVFCNWCRHFNLNNHQLHASGHASKGEIFEIIRETKPGRILPIHTTGFELFKKEFKVESVEKGRKIEL